MDAHLALTNTYRAHQEGYSGEGVGIAFLDTGINRQHPTLKGRVTYSKVSVDPDRSDLSVDDKLGHGTQVAQIAAGQNLGLWRGGIARKADLVSWRILEDAPGDADGRQKILPDTDLTADAGWISSKARIVNVSTDKLYWDDDFVADQMFTLFSYFVNIGGGADGKLVVVATGDSGEAQPSQLALIPEMPEKPELGINPGTLRPGWINVGAVKSADITQLADYSNACGITRSYCMVAPGDVFVTGADDTPDAPTYHAVSSTGYAAAQVSGAAALVWQQFPTMNNLQVQQILLASATDLGPPGVDEMFGWGMLDVAKAIKGPSSFDWGDFEILLNGGGSPMTWRNEISGSGGLVVWSPDGTFSSLSIEAPTTYTGKTVVNGGHVSVRHSMASPVDVNSGHFQAQGGTFADDFNVTDFGRLSITPDPSADHLVIAGDIFNGGVFHYSTAVAHATFEGDFTQGQRGVFEVVLGNDPLHVQGKVTLDGFLSVLGIADGYVANDHTLIMTADGGVSGSFTGLSHPWGLLLEATIASDANSVWLDVDRADVVTAASSGGLRTAALGSAQRVENAFRVIDRGVGGTAARSSADEFVAGAASIQRTSTIDALDDTLSSLSGELHSGDAAFAMMAMEDGRHALESRLDQLDRGVASGAWADRIGGDRPVGMHGSFDANGWMLGHDARLSPNLTVGAAFGQTDAAARHDLRRDRERNRQYEGQLYAAWSDRGNYVLGRLASGRMDRSLQRDILLGDARFGVGSDYANQFTSMGLQAGHRFGIGAGTLTPYIGTQALRLQRDGFTEQGAAGFGLSTGASTLEATQALAGARLERDWWVGAAKVSLQGRVEWQKTLSQSGQWIDARFTGIDAWAPITGAGLGEEATVFGLGLGTALPMGRLSLDVDARREFGRTWTGAHANWTVGF